MPGRGSTAPARSAATGIGAPEVARCREVRPGAGERDRQGYLEGINGMVYGEDPSEGFVRGRRFLHPKLGFTFQAPEGFTLDNTAQAVLGVREGGGQALRLDVVRVPAEQTLADYLTSGWIENIDPKTVEDVIINGLPAATATAASGASTCGTASARRSRRRWRSPR